MSEPSPLTPFARFVRLYTLHRVEQLPTVPALPAPGVSRLVVRIMTLRYTFTPLADAPLLDAAYADDPRAAAELVQRAVAPRLQTLLDSDDPFRVLSLAAGDDAVQAALWPRYAAARGLAASPVRVPVLRPPDTVAYLPSRSVWGERLARTERALNMLQTAAETASTLAALWQNWQIGREQRKLLAAQRLMLHDAIQAQLVGQSTALNRAVEPGFVRGYLAEHGGDDAYTAVYGAEDAPV